MTTPGGGAPGFEMGAISFKLDGVDVANADPTESGFTASTVDSDPLSAARGAYTYKAYVAGNDHYLGDDSPDEAVTADKAQLTIETSIHSATHGVVAVAI